MSEYSEKNEVNLPSRSRRYYWIFTFFFLFFGGLVAAITSFVNYNIQYTNIGKEITQKFEQEKAFKHELLHNFLQNSQNMVVALANSEITHHYLQTGDKQQRNTLKQMLVTTTASNSSFLQLRYIDASGTEIVRIDREKGSGQVIVVAENKLQNKKNRYYFREASLLPAGQFWHSNFDLNMEHGQIEFPIQPTFRIATPVFHDNKFSGLIIVNMSINSLLSILGASTDFEIYIIDKEGEFIIHPDNENSWSRYLPNRKNINGLFPQYSREILTMADIQRDDFYTFSLANKLSNHEDAIVILMPRKALLQELKDTNLLTAGIIALTVLLVSFVLSWLVALIPARLQANLNNAFNQIQNYADIINRFVITTSTDSKGTILKVSSACCEVSGYSPNELIGRNNNLIRHPDTPKELYEDMWGTILQGKTWRGEIKDKAKDGSSFWLKHIITPDFGEKGDICGFTSVSYDISDKKKIETLSITDGLTQLFNRRKLDEVILSEIDRFDRYKQPFSVVLLDLDNFKNINDTYGHKIGDLVLVKLANMLNMINRKTDIAGRWGGEEFMIICPNTHVAGAMKLAEKLRKAIEAENFPTVGNITSSFGVTQCYEGDTDDDIFLRTDNALYQAKEAGRNCVVKATEDIDH